MKGTWPYYSLLEEASERSTHSPVVHVHCNAGLKVVMWIRNIKGKMNELGSARGN